MSQRHPDASDADTELNIGTPLVARMGWLVAGSAPGALLVDFAGNTAGPRNARTTIAMNDETIERAIRTRQAVVLSFEDGRPERPIIMGLIQGEEPSLFETLLAPERAKADAADKKNRLEARVDGKRVVLEAEHEIVLRCGDASITLRRDGKVLLRGTYVETHSRGVNRIKGGCVKIN